jgi:glycosyltransferase 2 family protein
MTRAGGAARIVARVALRTWARRLAPPLIGLAAIGALVYFLGPESVGRAASRFNLAVVPLIIALYVAGYVLQGVRWHRLLRDAGVRLRLRESVLLNAAGQTITAVVPLGDLTRAAYAASAGRRDFGTVAATVTVQELTYNLMLVLLAMPVVLSLHEGVFVVVATVIGMAAIVVILTVSPVFLAVHRLIAHVPLLSRLLPAIDELQVETAELLHRPDALVLSVLDLGRALVAIAAFWAVVQGVSPGSLDWSRAAFVLAVSSIGGAISLIPGGVGANEAGVAGLLILFGLDPGSAAAAALIQRLALTGMAIVLGIIAHAIVRRRFELHWLPTVPATSKQAC